MLYFACVGVSDTESNLKIMHVHVNLIFSRFLSLQVRSPNLYIGLSDTDNEFDRTKAQCHYNHDDCKDAANGSSQFSSALDIVVGEVAG